MKSHVQAVVIGGGVVGASVLYHLAVEGVPELFAAGCGVDMRPWKFTPGMC